MIYVFDLDGTLCETDDRRYAEAKPFRNRIAAVNALYDQGHTIIVDSARGTITRDPFVRALTIEQLDNWGLKYHECRTGMKYFADAYVDDKAVEAFAFFDQANRCQA